MRSVCPLCASDEYAADGDDLVCLDCSYAWHSTIARQKPIFKGPGWVGEAMDVIAEAIRKMLLHASVVKPEDIDKWLLRDEQRFLNAIISAGSWSTHEEAASNARGWFNANWTMGTNPHINKFFVRTDKEPYHFSTN